MLPVHIYIASLIRVQDWVRVSVFAFGVSYHIVCITVSDCASVSDITHESKPTLIEPVYTLTITPTRALRLKPE